MYRYCRSRAGRGRPGVLTGTPGGGCTALGAAPGKAAGASGLPAACGAGGRPAIGPPGGCPGGGARFGSSFGCSVLVPLGPLNETSRGVILSMRHPLTESPSPTFNGLSPLTANNASRWSRIVTIPVSLESERSLSLAAPPEAPCGGRRVLLKSGRARAAPTSSSGLAFCGRIVGLAASERAVAWATTASSGPAGASSMKMIAPSRRQPPTSSKSGRRSIMASRPPFFRRRGRRRHRDRHRDRRLPECQAASRPHGCADCRSRAAAWRLRVLRGI